MSLDREHAAMVLREPVSTTSRIVRRGGVEVEESAQGWDLVDTATGERIALSSAAVGLWASLDGERTVGDIAQAIGQPVIDVIELIRRLRANGLAGDAPSARHRDPHADPDKGPDGRRGAARRRPRDA